MSIFKAYDIRGIYPEEISEEIARRVGCALVRHLGASRVGVGHDVRLSSPSMRDAVLLGVRQAGAVGVDLGSCTTPLVYFAVGHLGLCGGIMVTASHNPPRYSGLKICRENAIPVGSDSGLAEIRALAEARAACAGDPGGPAAEAADLFPEYREHLLRFLDRAGGGRMQRRPRIVVDTANGSVGPYLARLLPDIPADVVPLYFEPDGRFPHHEPNPLEDENLVDLVAAVRREQADLGVAFDGDGDRCQFVDERGIRIPGDLLTALLARFFLAGETDGAVVFDVRSSRVVEEEVHAAEGTPVRERVGHSFIKATMRKRRAVFGGELSGHYYFRENFYADSGLVAFLTALPLLAGAETPASEILAPLRRTFPTGEVNFRVADAKDCLRALTARFPGARVSHLDGLTLEFDDWWCNVRESNTEPLLRLNLEARTADLREARLAEIREVLGGGEE